MTSKRYTCGYCGSDVSSEKAFQAQNSYSHIYDWKIYICHSCDKPTFFGDSDIQTPGSVFGSVVKHITEESVEKLYDEARSCMSISAYTAAGMCCRKLLMHIAVAKGAEENLAFAAYVTYLETSGYSPADSKDWIDEIRKIGNVANHEISFLTREEAENLISFSEMLLKFIYEFPGKIKKT